MTESRIKELHEQNQRLHTLLISLSATLLRKVVAKYEIHGPFNRADAERFVHEAEECFRCAKMAGLRPEIADGLVVAAHHLMATAVDIETRLQRHQRRK
jgi:uncharacterized glyoxalase superfamily metalloenzyme YdcJ